MKRRLQRSSGLVFCAILLVVFCVASARAQNAAGRIIGNVTDETGGTIGGAVVTVTNVATQVSAGTSTNTDGFYQVLALPIGSYRITIEKEGFRKQVFENQTLEINQSLRLNTVLHLGSRNETVVVTEQAPTIETVNQTVGATVIGSAVQQAPLNGRNVLNLALLQPGVTESNSDNTSAGNFSIAGGRTDSVTYLLDGGMNNNLLSNDVVFNPNPDTIAEFRILESNYSAEFGRNGGGIISVVTKSGANQWHGSAFDFLRNDAFNANTFFNKVNDLPRNVLKRNQYGGTLGGPLTLPRLVNGKDRFFFFVGYQGQRLSQIQTTDPSQTPVFTPAELGGDFRNDTNVQDFLAAFPAFQAPGQPAGVIDPAMLNPTSVKYIAAGLIPSSSTGFVTPSASHTDNRNELTMKFDFLISEKDKLTATVGGSRNPVLDPFAGAGNVAFADVPGFSVSSRRNNYFVNIGYTRTFTPNVVNELRFVTQRNNTVQATPASKLPTAADLGMATTPDNPTGPPVISFDNGLTLGFTYLGPSTLVNNTFAVSDNLSWTHGRHNWKMGGGISSYQNNQVFDFLTNGLFDFGFGLGTGNSLADFLLGIPADYIQGAAAPSNIRTKSSYGFLQDEWRVTKRLTLTLGVRYEYSQPKTDTQGRMYSIVPGLQSQVFVNAPRGLVFPGDSGAPRGANFPDRNDWAPRIGFAWDPRGNGKTSIRGGFGIFYDVLKAEDNFQFNGAPPFFSLSFLGFPSIPEDQASPITFFSDPFGANGITNPFPSKPPTANLDFDAAGFLPFGAQLFFIDPHLRTPYTYQYNLSVQHELASSLILEVSYLGSGSHGLTSLVDANPFVLGTTDRVLNLGAGDSTCPDATAGNPNLFGCSFAPVLAFKNSTTASYNGLDVSLKKQMGSTHYLGRTYFTLGYTYSHNIDNVSGFRQRNNSTPSYQTELFRASSDSDIRHRITFSGAWDLPFDNLWGAGPKRLTQGWSLFPIVTWRTGFPMDVFALLPTDIGSEGPSGAGDPANAHANVVGSTATFDPRVVQTLTNPNSGDTSAGNYWFNPASFSNVQGSNTEDCTPPGPGMFPSDFQAVNCPELRTYGTLPRNFLRGPGRMNFDLAISKTTPITERFKMEFRAEFFNVFNRAQFRNPDTNIFSPTFGQITSTFDPRIIQFAVRFAF